MIDNNSTDGSREYFAGRFPMVRFTWQQQNTGFAKANNSALAQAKGRHILFLNPDTVLPEDCLEKCLHFFDAQSNIGVLGIRMIDGSGNFLPESKRGFPSAFASFCKITGLTALFPHSTIFARYYLGHLPEEKTNEADVLSGAFMMVEKKILDAVGSFDEDYFMYAEDIDLSYRIQKAGFKNFYFADAGIIHFKGESTTKQSAEYINHFYGTMMLFVKKHYPAITGTLYVLLLKMLMVIKKLFAASKPETGNKERPEKVYLVASGENDAASLKDHFSQILHIGNLSAAEKNSAVVFCEPGNSFAKIINSMQENKNEYSFFIHAGGTKSIVGSADKKDPGIAIAFRQ